MIALPVAAHGNNIKDSPGVMSGDHDEWPSLAGQPAEPSTSAGDGDDWELLTTTESGDTGVEVVPMPNPLPLRRKNSVSAPDLRVLDDDDDQTDSAVLVSNPGSVADSGGVVVVARPSPWGSKNKVSFKDAILSPSKHAPATASTVPKPRVKNKVKSRYVVTPIKRCAKSTGDLLSLVAENEEDEEEPMGDTDANEYYSRKAHGAHGRSNGLKTRPDEAKRKEMIVQKKNLQRQRQGKQ